MKNIALTLGAIIFIVSGCSQSKSEEQNQASNLVAATSATNADAVFEKLGDQQTWKINTNGSVRIDQTKFGLGQKSSMSLVLYYGNDDNNQENHGLPLVGSFTATGPFRMKVWGRENADASRVFSTKGGDKSTIARFEGGQGAEVEFQGVEINH